MSCRKLKSLARLNTLEKWFKPTSSRDGLYVKKESNASKNGLQRFQLIKIHKNEVAIKKLVPASSTQNNGYKTTFHFIVQSQKLITFGSTKKCIVIESKNDSPFRANDSTLICYLF